jgi:hypothetical protein
VATEVNNSVGVSPFVIVPRNDLDKVGVQGDTSVDVEDGGVGVSNEIGADNFISGVSEDSLTRLL